MLSPGGAEDRTPRGLLMRLTRLAQDCLVVSCFRGSEEDCTLINKGFGTSRLAGYTGMGSLHNATMMRSGFLLVMRSLSLNHSKFEVTVATGMVTVLYCTSTSSTSPNIARRQGSRYYCGQSRHSRFMAGETCELNRRLGAFPMAERTRLLRSPRV